VSENQFSTEVELYGTSPTIIAMIMIVTTLLAPCGIIPSGISESESYWILYSLLWVLDTGGFFGIGFRVLSFDLMYTVPLCILHVTFVVWIVRYYQAKTSQSSVMTISLLSLMLPTFLALYVSGGVIIIYPFPLQFIVGLAILWRIEGPEVISPWSGMRLDLSWWKWRRPKRRGDWDPFEREKDMVEQEESS
jgi:hypothetical protein